MKHIKYLVVIALLISGSVVNAQGRQGREKARQERNLARQGQNSDRQAKILEKKIVFFKENLMLTKQESADFEKAYRAFEQQREALKNEFRTEVLQKIKRGNTSNLSEKEQRALIDKKLAIDKKRYELNRNFTLQLTKMLPPVKVIKYYKLEREFNRKMMRRLKKGRSEMRGKKRQRGMNGRFNGRRN